jgi:hypothetical protein
MRDDTELLLVHHWLSFCARLPDTLLCAKMTPERLMTPSNGLFDRA